MASDSASTHEPVAWLDTTRGLATADPSTKERYPDGNFVPLYTAPQVTKNELLALNNAIEALAYDAPASATVIMRMIERMTGGAA